MKSFIYFTNTAILTLFFLTSFIYSMTEQTPPMINGELSFRLFLCWFFGMR